MTVSGRKQIHISSHVAKSWLNTVGDIIDPDTGTSAFHTINQKFKCSAHGSVPGMTCPCLEVYCPTHIDINSNLQTLINNVSPGGETELTGAGGDAGTLKSDVGAPFSDGTIQHLERSTYDITQEEIVRFVIAMDPTYSTGSQSAVGVTTVAELKSGILVILAIEEAEVADLEYMFDQFYLALIMAHIKLAHSLSTQTEDIVFMPETNTYSCGNHNLWTHLKVEAKRHHGIELKVYIRSKKDGSTDIGRVMGRDKPGLVLQLAEAIRADKIGKALSVLSFGNFIRGIFLNRTHELELKYKVRLNPGSEATGPNAIVPKRLKDFKLMTSEESLSYVLSYGTASADVPGYNTAIDTDGANLWTKLKIELRMVEIVKKDSNLKVKTGGKKSRGGMYTKDDLFSSLLLVSTIITDPKDSFTFGTWG